MRLPLGIFTSMRCGGGCSSASLEAERGSGRLALGGVPRLAMRSRSGCSTPRGSTTTGRLDAAITCRETLPSITARRARGTRAHHEQVEGGGEAEQRLGGVAVDELDLGVELGARLGERRVDRGTGGRVVLDAFSSGSCAIARAPSRLEPSVPISSCRTVMTRSASPDACASTTAERSASCPSAGV